MMDNETILNGIDIVSNQFGRTAVAKRPFRPGEIVLREAPLLVFRTAIDRATEGSEGPLLDRFRKVEQLHHMEHYFDALRAADESLSGKEIQFLMDDLYSPVRPSNTGPKGTVTLSSAECSILRDLFSDIGATFKPSNHAFWESVVRGGTAVAGKPSRKGTSKNRNDSSNTDPTNGDSGLLKIGAFLHAVRVNLHSDDRRGVSGVFRVASKFAHNCSPNTYWFMEIESPLGTGSVAEPLSVHVVHVATARIEAGDVLSFSYVGTGTNLLTHTLERRHMLSVLNFVCQCPRCAKYDARAEKCRVLSCPACVARERRHLPDDKSSTPPATPERKSPCGALTLVPDRGWQCGVCGQCFLDFADVAHFVRQEGMLQKAALALFFSHGQRPESESGDVAGLLGTLSSAAKEGLSLRWHFHRYLRQQLGGAHYLSAVSSCGLFRAFIQSCAPRNDPLPSDSNHEANGCSDFAVFCSEGWAQCSVDRPAAKPWCSELLGFALETHQWFEENMPKSPQHIRTLCTISELVVGVVIPNQQTTDTPISTPSEGVARIGAGTDGACDHKHCCISTDNNPFITVLENFRRKTVLPLIQPFEQVAEFAPLRCDASLAFGTVQR